VWRIFAWHVLCYECYCEERATLVPVMSHACPHKMKTFNHVCSNVQYLPKIHVIKGYASNPCVTVCYLYDLFLLHAVIIILFFCHLVSPSDGFLFTFSICQLHSLFYWCKTAYMKYLWWSLSDIVTLYVKIWFNLQLSQLHFHL